MENTNISWLVAIILVIGIALVGGWYLGNQNSVQSNAPSENPDEEVSQGESTTQATTTYSNADENMIIVDTPIPGATVGHIVTVSGKARGNWYFEANFPIEVRSATGTVLVQAPVQAQEEWMTTEFVPFTVQVTLPAEYKGPATLVLHNDNASGLPEHDRSVSIPIVVQ
jgi:hypothetical protein